MSEVFSLEDILGPPKSSIRLNYEFNFIGKNTHLIGTKSTSYPPIHDDLVEKEIVKEEEGDWLGWGLNLVIGIAVTAACAVVAVAAAPVTVTVAVVAGCAAVGSAVATTAIAVSDYHNGKPHPRAWWEAAGGILFGAGIGAVVGAELCYFPSVIAGTAEVAGIQASMWAGASSMFTSVAVPKLATGLGYGLLGMNAIFGLDQASGVGDGETLLRRQNPELYDNLAMMSMILTEGYSSVGLKNSIEENNSKKNDNRKSGVGVTGKGISIEEVDEKVLKEIHTDKKAAYGYSPNEGTSYDKYDFTDIEATKNNRAIRKEYLKQSEKIQIEIDKMTENGASKKVIANKVIDMRNQDKVTARVKMKPEEVAPIEARNMKIYGNKVGPDANWLFVSKTNKLRDLGLNPTDDEVWDAVISGSMKKDNVLNTLLGLKH